MFEIFAALFDRTLLVIKYNPDGDKTPGFGEVVSAFVNATFHTALRAAVILSFTYGAIRIVATAIRHGSF